MMKSVIGLLLALLLMTSPVWAQTPPPIGYINWVDWTVTTPAGPAGLPTVIGSIGPVTVTFAGDLSLAPQLGAAADPAYWNTNSATYTGPGVPFPPSNKDVIRFIGGPTTGTQTLTFSQPVTNPVMTLLSLGGLSTVQMNFGSQPFEILKVGPGHFGNGTLTRTGNILEGREGNGLIRFLGTMSSISWTTPVVENWSGFTIGLDPGMPAISPAAPPVGRSIAVSKVGTGTGVVMTSVGNVSCGIAPAPVVCLSTFRLKVGTPVTITATASAGSVFAGWVGLPVACALTSCQFTMPNQHVQVRATFKLATPVVPDTVAPTAPILRGYAHSPTILQLEWPQVTDNEGVHSFTLQRCVGVSSTCNPWTVVASGITALTFLQGGLLANTDYVYRLQARDWAGNLSVWSDILTLKTPATGTVAWTLNPVSVSITRQTTEDPNAPNPRYALSIVNTGTVGLTLSWSTPVAWIVDVIPANGQLTIAPGATGFYSFAVTRTPWGCVGGCPLPPQAYTGTVSIAGGATTRLFTMAMRLETPGTPILTATPVVSLTMVPNQQALASLITQNVGLGTISFLASESIPWLTTPVGPGTLTGPSQSGASTLTVNTTGLAPGTYTGTVMMTPTAPWTSIAPVVTTVNLTVLPPATIALDTTNVTIQGQVTLPNPQGFSVAVSNVGTGLGIMSWTATKSATWLAVAPVSGTVATGGPGVGILLAGLLPGTYTGTVTIASPGASNTPQTITVTLVVLPAPVFGRASLTWDHLPVPMLAADGTILLNPGLPLFNPDGTPQLNPDGTPMLAPGVPVTAIGYHVWRSLVPGVYPIGPLNFSPTWNGGAPVGTVPFGTNVFIDTTVIVGTIYYYVVTSYNEAGDSPRSNEVNMMITTTTGGP